jgi:hypothetical protein
VPVERSCTALKDRRGDRKPVHRCHLAAARTLRAAMLRRAIRSEHRRFLEENRPDLLTALQWSGDLDDYLTSIGETASERLSDAMRGMLNDPQHQKLPHLERVRALQNRQQETEELIRHDLILQPTGD